MLPKKAAKKNVRSKKQAKKNAFKGNDSEYSNFFVISRPNKMNKRKQKKLIRKSKKNKDIYSMDYRNGYIPVDDLTDPIEYAATAALQYDSNILNYVAEFKIEEERLLKKLRDNGII